MKLRRRTIEDRDLDAVADLLARGFPRRSLSEWRQGLIRLRSRDLPPDTIRYGLCLEQEGRLVGVILMIFGLAENETGAVGLRCNLSSWYVDPAFAFYAPALLNAALSDPNVTYLNLTPAPHTEAIVTAQGFTRFCSGSILCAPALSLRGLKHRVRRLTHLDLHLFPEHALLRQHLDLGCLCFFVEDQGTAIPFVFAAPRRLRGVVPGAHLLYCRALADLARFAGPLGRALLRNGAVALLIDSNEAPAGLLVRFINQKQGRFYKGPNAPKPGDLAFAEFAVFGG